VVDLHFHLLPGVDDGPADPATALALARAAVAGGTTVVVATPHVSARWVDNDALQIADAVLLLRRALREQGIDLDVRRGAEVALTRALDVGDGELDRLGLDGGPWLLVECPSEGGPTAQEAMLRTLLDDDRQLLLAHPERIPAFREAPTLLQRLVGEGVRCQVTAGALTGRFGREAKRYARWMLEEGVAHVVSSDAHSVAHRTPSLLPELREAGVGDALARWLTQDAPAALLAGEELPAAPAAAVPRRGRRWRARSA
jgi:protein-tyrosine phosphatase